MDYNSQKPLVELPSIFICCYSDPSGSCSLILFASLYLLRLCIQRCQLSWIVTLSQRGQSFLALAQSWRLCLQV